MEDPLALKYMLKKIGWSFIYNEKDDCRKNLKNFKNFFEFVSPMHCSATEGDHRLDLANRLLYGIELEQKAPFLKVKDDFQPLPFSSTVFKPIPASVFLPCEGSSDLCLSVASHLQQLSRKTAGQKKLFIEDDWRSLYESIFDAIARDSELKSVLYSTQKEFYLDPVKVRQDSDHRARVIRQRLGQVITEVIFTENPTATLAKEPVTVNQQKWTAAVQQNVWTNMDANPFTAVSTKNIVSIIFGITKIMVTIIFVKA